MTAKQWRSLNPKVSGNIRDNATIEQLIVLANLENLNAEYIRDGLSQSERLFRLNQVALYQLNTLLTNPPKSIETLKKLQK